MIYFIQCGKNGPIKIGYTGNVEGRLASMQTSCPYELKLLWSIKGDTDDEQDLHEEWKHERIRGEWFHPSKKLLEYINKWASNDWEIKLSDDQTIDITETKSTLHINGGGWWIKAKRNEATLVIDAADHYKIVRHRDG